MTSPLLVHNRIEKNHRSTIILLALVPLLLLPFAASLAVWLAPWVLIEGMIAHLPEHAAVTVCGTEGNFLKVTTAHRVVGYISQSARDRVIATPGN